MGWGEPHRPNPLRHGDNLAAAVRRFLAAGTTGNHERLRLALAAYEAERERMP